jgi:hypothetical protein
MSAQVGVSKIVCRNNSLFVGILQSNVVLLLTPLFSWAVPQLIKNKNSNLSACVVFVQIAEKCTRYDCNADNLP